jgi:hypothetical protein
MHPRQQFRGEATISHLTWFWAKPLRGRLVPSCAQLSGEITALQNEISELQQDLQHAAGSEKISLIHQIAQDHAKLAALEKQKQQNGCQ